MANRIRPEIQKQIDSLLERDKHFSAVHMFYLGVVLFSLVVTAMGVFKGVAYLIDDEIPVVECPTAYKLDAPVTLYPSSQQSIKQKDGWIKGFIRRYTTYQFPRKSEDISFFLNYVKNHSKGDVRYKYETYLKSGSEFADLIKNGSYYRFYQAPSNDALRIRHSFGESWVVEIDGFLVRTAGTQESRNQVTLKYHLASGTNTALNPEGLYVTNEERITTDWVTGNKEVKK